MPIYEISKWVVVLSECMVSLLGMFLISRYVFLEPSLEEKKQKVYYIISFSVVFVICLLFGNDLASILSMIFCGVNIIIGRSKGKIRGVFNIVPICGFLNGLLIPVLVVPVQLFRLQERYLIIYSLIFYGILAIVLLLFYFKGKNWRKTFKEELQSHSIILAPKEHPKTIKELESLTNGLRGEYKDKIKKIDLEDFVNAIINNCPKEYRIVFECFYERYLNFDKLGK